MELKEFIKYAIDEVVTGVHESQEKYMDGDVIICPPNIEMQSNAEGVVGLTNSNLTKFSANQTVSAIHFDVSVTAEDKVTAGAKGGLKILDFGLSSDISNAEISREVSRLKFTIPLVLPNHRK
jgi:hypothetical protein